MNWINENGIQLPAINLYYFQLENYKYGNPDKYGSSYIVAEYLGVKRKNYQMRFAWSHGCNLPSHNYYIHGKHKHDRINKIFVVREDIRMQFPKNKLKDVKAIGCPILYTQIPKLKRINNSLLLMPMHLSNTLNQGENIKILESFITEALTKRDVFDLIAISLHEAFYSMPDFLALLDSFNIKRIEGAKINDKNALLRQRALFEQFETVCSNGYGSHIPYALAFGCKVSIIAKPIKYVENINGKLITAFTDLIQPEDEESFLQQFRVEPDSAIYNPQLGKFLIGQQHKLTPEAMRIEFQYNNWNKLNYFCLKFKKFVGKFLLRAIRFFVSK